MAERKAETKKRATRTTSPSRAKAREGKKAVVGYFSPKVSQQLRILGANEDKSVQALLGEAIDLLLESRGIAPHGER